MLELCYVRLKSSAINLTLHWFNWHLIHHTMSDHPSYEHEFSTQGHNPGLESISALCCSFKTKSWLLRPIIVWRCNRPLLLSLLSPFSMGVCLGSRTKSNWWIQEILLFHDRADYVGSVSLDKALKIKPNIVQYSANRWRLCCVISRPGSLWPQGWVHTT